MFGQENELLIDVYRRAVESLTHASEVAQEVFLTHIVAIRESLKFEREDHEKWVKRLKDEIEELEEKVVTLQDAMEDLEEKIDNIEQKVERLEDEKDSLREKLHMAKQENLDIDAERNRIRRELEALRRCKNWKKR